MNPLRADPPSFQLPLPASRNAGPGRNDSPDAFSQILDRHLNDQSEAPVSSRARETARPSDDAPRDAEPAAKRVQSRQTLNRRGDGKKPAAASGDGFTTVARKGAAKPTTQKPAPADSAANGGNPQKPETKTEPDDPAQTSDANAAAQPAPDGKAANVTPDADGNPSPDGDPNAQQQQSGDKPAATPQAAGGDAIPDANAALIQPLSGIQVLQLTGISAAPTSGGKPGASTVQSGLIIAADQAAVLQSLGSLSPVAGEPAAAEGLKFGLVVAAARDAQGQPGTAAAPSNISGDAGDIDATAADADPAGTTTIAAATGKTLPNPNRTSSNTTKSRAMTDQSTTAAPVPLDQNGKIPAFALSFPGNRPAASVPTAMLEGDISASVAVTGGDSASDDAELSAFSQYLGPGVSDALARANTLRQSSFITQLKQSLQALPPHEQIAVQIQNAMQNGSSRMTVDLQPAELGRVEIKLDVDKDKNVSATIVADRPATLDLLQRDAKALERALQQAGLQADSGSLSFSLRDSGNQGGGQGQGGNGGSGGTGADGNAAAAAGQPVKTDVVAIATGYVDLET